MSQWASISNDPDVDDILERSDFALLSGATREEWAEFSDNVNQLSADLELVQNFLIAYQDDKQRDREEERMEMILEGLDPDQESDRFKAGCPFCQFSPEHDKAAGSLNRHLKAFAKKPLEKRGLHPGEHSSEFKEIAEKRHFRTNYNSASERKEGRKQVQKRYKTKAQKIEEKVEAALNALRYFLMTEELIIGHLLQHLLAHCLMIPRSLSWSSISFLRQTGGPLDSRMRTPSITTIPHYQNVKHVLRTCSLRPGRNGRA
jgi:hypothetical protein